MPHALKSEPWYSRVKENNLKLSHKGKKRERNEKSKSKRKKGWRKAIMNISVITITINGLNAQLTNKIVRLNFGGKNSGICYFIKTYSNKSIWKD